VTTACWQAARPAQHSGTRRAGADLLPSKGALIRKLLEDWMREQYLARGTRSFRLHTSRARACADLGPPRELQGIDVLAMELDDGFYRRSR